MRLSVDKKTHRWSTWQPIGFREQSGLFLGGFAHDVDSDELVPARPMRTGCSPPASESRHSIGITTQWALPDSANIATTKSVHKSHRPNPGSFLESLSVPQYCQSIACLNCFGSLPTSDSPTSTGFLYHPRSLLVLHVQHSWLKQLDCVGTFFLSLIL